MAVEKRYKIEELPVQHPLLAWAVEYTGVVLNRCEVGRDGRAAHERLKGKKGTMPGLEFAEGVLWKAGNRGGALGKLSTTWRTGVYVGIRAKSGEFIVADAQGTWKTRSARRRPFDERWDVSNLELIKNTPWKDEAIEKGETLEQTEPVAVKMSRDEAARETEFKEIIPRNVYIKAKDLQEHGYTSGCPGCVSIIRGRARARPTPRRAETESRSS